VAHASVNGRATLPINNLNTKVVLVGNDRVIDVNGNEIVDKKFDIYPLISDEMILAQDETGKYGYFDISGEPVIPFEFDYAMPFEYGSAIVGIENTYFVIDKNGNRKNPLKLDFEPHYFRDASWLCVVRQDGKVGLVNGRSFEIILNVEYKNIRIRKLASLIWAQKDNKFGAYTISDEMVAIPVVGHIFDDIYLLDESRVFVKKDGKWGVMDSTGNITIDFVFDGVSICRIGDDCFGVLPFKDAKWNLVDIEGKALNKGSYDEIHTNIGIDGRAVVCKEGLYGLIDEYGNELTALEYDECFYFSGGTQLAIVKSSAKYGVIDSFGNQIQLCIYDDLFVANNDGYFKAKKDEKYGLLDERAQVLLDCEHEYIGYFDKELFCIKKDTKMCLFGGKIGKIEIPHSFQSIDHIESVGDGLCSIEKNGLCALASYKIKKSIMV
jgi:hypothetical protein